jgi:hypothetical protein
MTGFSINTLYYFSLSNLAFIFSSDKFIDVYHSKTSFLIEFSQSLYFFVGIKNIFISLLPLSPIFRNFLTGCPLKRMGHEIEFKFFDRN